MPECKGGQNGSRASGVIRRVLLGARAELIQQIGDCAVRRSWFGAIHFDNGTLCDSQPKRVRNSSPPKTERHRSAKMLGDRAKTSYVGYSGLPIIPLSQSQKPPPSKACSLRVITLI